MADENQTSGQWVCPNCKKPIPLDQPCGCGMRPPVPPPANYSLPQVSVGRVQVPFGDIFMITLKVGLAIIPVGFIVGLAYLAITALFSAGLMAGLLGSVKNVAP